jgi:hypothetical protein
MTSDELEIEHNIEKKDKSEKSIKNNSGKPLHIVCGEFEGDVAIITVYVPMPPKFRNPYERG